MSLWRVEEAASYLGIRPKTLYEWVRTGRVPHRKLGFNVRFDPAELAEWVEEQSSGAEVAGDSDESGGPGVDPKAVEELRSVAEKAAERLRRIETELGAQLSFPERQKLQELAGCVEAAVEAVRPR